MRTEEFLFEHSLKLRRRIEEGLRDIISSSSDGRGERLVDQRNPFPDGKHVKKLKGYEEQYRLRVGDFRVVFQRSGSRIDVIDVLSKPDFQKAY